VTDGDRGRVLIVVDDIGLVWPARHALESRGYQVRWSGDAKSAISALEIFGPELVIVDVMLPRREGWTVLDTIRAYPQEERPKVIVMSGATGFEQTAQIEALGASGILAKPFGVDQLVSQVGRALGR